MNPDPGAAIDRTKVLRLIRAMVGIQVKRDDAAALAVLILRGGDVDVAVATDGEMTDLTKSFGDDGRMKAGRQRQTIRFFRGHERDCRRDDQTGGKRLHLASPSPSPRFARLWCESWFADHSSQSAPKSSHGCIVRTVPLPQRRSSAGQYLSQPQQVRSGCAGCRGSVTSRHAATAAPTFPGRFR